MRRNWGNLSWVSEGPCHPICTRTGILLLHLPSCLDVQKNLSWGRSYSKLLTSGKAPLYGFEHARKIIWPICHSAWQAWTHCLPINVLGLMLQFQDLSCSHGIGSYVWTRMDWGLECASLSNGGLGFYVSLLSFPNGLFQVGAINACAPQHSPLCLQCSVYAPAAL